DISTHVDWTSLLEAAQAADAMLLGFADQHHFLTGILANLMGATWAEKLSDSDRRGLQTLLHPEMLGRNFQVLALGKNISEPLGGFRFARDSRADPALPD